MEKTILPLLVLSMELRLLGHLYLCRYLLRAKQCIQFWVGLAMARIDNVGAENFLAQEVTIIALSLLDTKNNKSDIENMLT